MLEYSRVPPHNSAEQVGGECGGRVGCPGEQDWKDQPRNHYWERYQQSTEDPLAQLRKAGQRPRGHEGEDKQEERQGPKGKA